MFDIWIGDVNLTLIVMALAAFVFLPLQMLLCFKVRSLFIRLMPVIIFTVLSVMSGILCMTITGWDVLLWLVILIYSLFSDAVCALGWIIYSLITLGKSKQK